LFVFDGVILNGGSQGVFSNTVSCQQQRQWRSVYINIQRTNLTTSWSSQPKKDTTQKNLPQCHRNSCARRATGFLSYADSRLSNARLTRVGLLFWRS